MALTDDQKAMLRLLAQREEGYEDMASLMGIGVEELRARVKEALAEVEEGAPVAPAPARTPQAEAQPAEPPAPVAGPPPPAPSPKAPSSPPPRTRPTLKLPRPSISAQNRGAAIGVGAGVAVILVLVVILLVGGSGGGSSPESTAGGRESEIAAAESGQLTQAILAPTAGGNASGRALFGRYKKNVLLQVEAEGLDPAPRGESYTVWLYRSPKLALRIGAVPVNRAGKIAAQLPIPLQLLSYVASGAFDQVDVSLTSEAAYKAELAKAKGEKRLPAYTGESVLRGQITGPAIKKR